MVELHSRPPAHELERLASRLYADQMCLFCFGHRNIEGCVLCSDCEHGWFDRYCRQSLIRDSGAQEFCYSWTHDTKPTLDPMNNSQYDYCVFIVAGDLFLEIQDT